MLNYNNLRGNLASTTELLQTEEPLLDDLTIQHIANQCSVNFTLYCIDCKVNCDLSKSKVDWLQKLDELQPHQFAQVFKAAKKKNHDILSYDKAMCHYYPKNWYTYFCKALLKLGQQECPFDKCLLY